MFQTDNTSDLISLVTSRLHLTQERSGRHVYAVKRPNEIIDAELADVRRRLSDMLPTSVCRTTEVVPDPATAALHRLLSDVANRLPVRRPAAQPQ